MSNQPRFVLGATFYTPALEKPFELALSKRGTPHSVICVPYNQLTNFFLNPSATVTGSESTRVVVLVRVEDLIRLEVAALGKQSKMTSAICITALRQRVSEFLEILMRVKSLRYGMMICASGKGAYNTSSLGNVIHVAEHRIAATVRKQQKHLFIPWYEFEQATATKNLFNPAGDRLGHVPFTPEGLSAIAEFFTQRLDRIPSAQNAEPASIETGNLRTFLASLNVEVEISELTVEDEQKVRDLTRHTTHFITKPAAKWEVGSLRARAAEQPARTAWHLTVRDRFGTYGTSGLVLFGNDQHRLQVKFLFLTCPVLGKQVEYALFHQLAREAERRGAEIIQIPVEHGRDNSILSDLLDRLSEQSNGSHAQVRVPGSMTHYQLRVAGLRERVARAAPNPDALMHIVSESIYQGAA
jgi:hypothetical protein